MSNVSPRQSSVFQRLLKALDDGGHTHSIEDVMTALRDGRARIWVGAEDSLVVTEIIVYPCERVMRYWLAAGDLSDMRPLLPEMEDWGREHGAGTAELIGRLGWTREARAHGYRHAAAVYRKDL